MEDEPAIIERAKKNQAVLDDWKKDAFLFADEALNMKAAEPIDSLCGKAIKYKDANGQERTTILFDEDGRLVYHDLTFYKMAMFKNQGKVAFKKYNKTRLTWQQTVTMTAYQRGLDTFDRDSFDAIARHLTIRSGHGTGKTASLCIVALHFLVAFQGAQIGVTANTEDQLKDIFLKELYYWRKRLPGYLQDEIVIMDDFVRISEEKDWFLRARVGRKETPEALAGLHGEYILIMADEASAIPEKVFEVMKGALTGDNFITIYTSNPTRVEGEFYDSHKPGAPYVKLHYNSRHSPIVKDGFINRMEEEYGKDSDEVAIRVDGNFASVTEMDDKGWIPLFANVRVMFEPERQQIIRYPIIGVDPAGKGRDRSIVNVRDSVYLKEVLNERTSTPKDLARKIETIRDAYQAKSNDIGIEAFGIGAEVVANVETKVGETVYALLTDKPREETKGRFNSYKSELAWKFRTWIINGGIIISNRPKDWMKELEKIKYKRDGQGRICLMDKVTFKKEYAFSPDKFDAAIHTFFKDEGTVPVILTKEQTEQKDMVDWIKRAQAKKSTPAGDQQYSSM